MRKLLFALTSILAFNQLLVAQLSTFAPPPPEKSSNHIDAKFADGSATWQRYLERNINAKAAVEAKAPSGTYSVKVRFLIDTTGQVTNVEAVSIPPLCKPCALDAVKVIQSSPKWTPSMQDGKPVSYKAIQYVNYQVLYDTVRPLYSGPILVQFQNISLREAIKKAGNTGKIVFAQFVTDRCDQCNEVADMAMRSPLLAQVVNEKCIPILISLTHPDRKEFVETYNPNQYLGTYFISGDEDILNRFPKTSSRAADYIAEVEKALAKQTEGRVTMKELDEEWNTNPGNITAMEMNLQKRIVIGWKTDSLLDVYVKRLPVDSLQSKRVLQFIASQAPNLFSNASMVMKANQSLFDKMWYEMPLQTRVRINNIILNKSLHRAVDMKSTTMAERVASYARGTYNDTSIGANRTYELQWLNYYRGVKDTAAALTRAVHYYDNYVMTINKQAIHRTDSIALRRALDSSLAHSNKEPSVVGKAIMNISYLPFSVLIATDLTQAATFVYSSTTDTSYLQKAIAWAKRAHEFNKFVDVQNTYAKLLYITGKKDEAVQLLKETVQELKRIGKNSTIQETILTQMEANQSLKDRL